jgi:hypothetical protein
MPPSISEVQQLHTVKNSHGGSSRSSSSSSSIGYATSTSDDSSDDSSSVVSTFQLKKKRMQYHSSGGSNSRRAKPLNYHQLSVLDDESSTAAIRRTKKEMPCSKQPKSIVTCIPNIRRNPVAAIRSNSEHVSSRSRPRRAVAPSRSKSEQILLPKPSSIVDKTPPISTTDRSIQTKRPKKNASVHFSDFDSVYEIPHIKNMTPEEIRDVWLTRKERKRIDRNSSRIVAQLEAALRHDGGEEGDAMARLLILSIITEEECYRGLECQTPTAVQQREEIQEAMYKDVISMQNFQKRRGVVIPQALAEICSKHTAACQQEALAAAFRDALHAHHHVPTKRL